MSRNIVIYSDGTGQRGGVMFDERRSNIYKLYRATRCGPDSDIDPAQQYAFYDPGIGTTKGGLGFFGTVWNLIYNVVCQASGLGLTGNVIDCYAALIRNWQPDDHIFLFGFSRGAYAMRCLGAVIALCGIPTMDSDEPLKRDVATSERIAKEAVLKRDMATSKRIAKEAVKRVYQHTNSRPRVEAPPRQIELLDQRLALAERFREKYRSGDSNAANVYPHFIGVFDTVAALSNPVALLFVLLAILAIIVILGWILSVGLNIKINWAIWILGAIAGAGFLAFVANLFHRVRLEIGLRISRWWRPFHLLDWRMRFYDMTLDPNVRYARHALAIDERRKAFDRVGWGTRGDHPERRPNEPEWFQQIWFSGCHSDVGGSYPEDESRLSDIALKWMLDAAVSVGLKFDPSVLKLYPDPKGMQHDETRRFPFKWLPKIDRYIPWDAPLHPTVIQRFGESQVLQYDLFGPYRPAGLSRHNDTAAFYGATSGGQN